MDTANGDFNSFLERREKASTAFVNGHAEPLAGLSARTSPATLFGPKGDCVQGAPQVNAANAEGARRFRGASRNDFEAMHIGVDDHLAYWVGLQRSIVEMEGQDKPVPFDLRVTEIYRREDGQWKLIHRHADPLKPS